MADPTSAPLADALQRAYDGQYITGTAEAARFDQWRNLGAQAKVVRLFSLIERQHLRPVSVLEVGAGQGGVLHGLVNRFAEVGHRVQAHALEISTSGVEAILARGIPGLASAAQFDGYHLPMADQSIDLIVLSHVLEHVEHERQLLRELHRVGRWLLVEVPRELQPLADTRADHYLSYGHINLYVPTSLRFLLASEGFAVLAERLDLTPPELLKMSYGGTMTLGRRAEFALRQLIMALPVRALHERFCNTITLLTQTRPRPAVMGQ